MEWHKLPESKSDEWISVKDRLPDHREQVLAFNGSQAVKYFEKGNNGYFFYDGHTDCYCPVGLLHDVTHWKPLPQPPQDKKSIRYFMSEMTQQEFEEWTNIEKKPYKFNLINRPKDA